VSREIDFDRGFRSPIFLASVGNRCNWFEMKAGVTCLLKIRNDALARKIDV